MNRLSNSRSLSMLLLGEIFEDATKVQKNSVTEVAVCELFVDRFRVVDMIRIGEKLEEKI